MAEWIKCSDRLPEEDGYYLGMCYGRRCALERVENTWYTVEYFDPYIGKDIRFKSFDELCEWTQKNVTFWMPLPKSPNG